MPSKNLWLEMHVTCDNRLCRTLQRANGRSGCRKEKEQKAVTSVKYDTHMTCKAIAANST